MFKLPHILAEDGEGISRIIFAAIFVLIWIVSAIAGAINKKKEERRRREIRETIERTTQGSPSARVPPPARPAPPRKVAKAPARRPPPLRKPVEEEAIVLEVAEHGIQRPSIEATEITDGTRRRGRSGTTVNADAIAAWLRPETLRRQFILTEILQPPVALRDDRRIE